MIDVLRWSRDPQSASWLRDYGRAHVAMDKRSRSQPAWLSQRSHDPRPPHLGHRKIFTWLFVMIRVMPGHLQAVGKMLASHESVVYLGYTTGRSDIVVEALFENDEALFRFLDEELSTFGGIVSTARPCRSG